MRYFLNAGAWSFWAMTLSITWFSLQEVINHNGISPNTRRSLTRIVLPALAVGALFQWARAAAWVAVSFAGQQTPYGRWVTEWGWIGVYATAIAGVTGLICAMRWRRDYLIRKAELAREATRLASR
jgi:hypothetical protein